HDRPPNIRGRTTRFRLAANAAPAAFGGQNHIPTVINCIALRHAGTDRSLATSAGECQGKAHAACRSSSQRDGCNLSFTEADGLGSRRGSLVGRGGHRAIVAGAETDEVAGAYAGSLHPIVHVDTAFPRGNFQLAADAPDLVLGHVALRGDGEIGYVR